MPAPTSTHHSDSRFQRALAFAGAVGPVLFVIVFTVAGLLRPGYSATAEAVSDLGVGPQAWLQNANFVAFGLSLLGLAVAFRRAMHHVIDRRAATIAGLLIGATGTGVIASAVFTAAPNTEGLHLLLGFVLAFGSAIATTIYVGRKLRGVAGWERFARYSRATGIGAGALVALSFVALNPNSPLEPLQLGGLIERLLVIELFAWHTMVGWRLLRPPAATSATGRSVGGAGHRRGIAVDELRDGSDRGVTIAGWDTHMGVLDGGLSSIH